MHTHMQPTQKKIPQKSCLIQIVMGFSWDLQPHFRYCTLFQVMSFVWSSVESERRGLFLTQWIHKNKQKPNCWPWCWSFILGDSDCKFLVPRGPPNKLSFILGEMNWKTWHLHDSIFVLPLNDILFWKKRKTHTQKVCLYHWLSIYPNVPVHISWLAAATFDLFLCCVWCIILLQKGKHCGVFRSEGCNARDTYLFTLGWVFVCNLL